MGRILVVILALVFVAMGCGALNNWAETMIATPQVTIQEQANAIEAQSLAIQQQAQTIQSQSSDLVQMANQMVDSAEQSAQSAQSALIVVMGWASIIIIALVAALFKIVGGRNKQQPMQHYYLPPQSEYRQLPSGHSYQIQPQYHDAYCEEKGW